MKHYFFILLLLVTFSGCDWYADPYVIGSGQIQFDEQQGYICIMEKSTTIVDSVLCNNTQTRLFTSPQTNQTVTSFMLGGKQYFFDGIATSKEIKKSFFAGLEFVGNTLNFGLLMFMALGLYGYASWCARKEKRKNQQQS